MAITVSEPGGLNGVIPVAMCLTDRRASRNCRALSLSGLSLPHGLTIKLISSDTDRDNSYFEQPIGGSQMTALQFTPCTIASIDSLSSSALPRSAAEKCTWIKRAESWVAVSSYSGPPSNLGILIAQSASFEKGTPGRLRLKIDVHDCSTSEEVMLPGDVDRINTR